MQISVRVIDGINGRPATDVAVRVASGPDGAGRHGRTDDDGEFACVADHHDLATNDQFAVEIDTDAYFSAMGVISCYKTVIFPCRVLDTADSYRVTATITPFSQHLSCTRL